MANFRKRIALRIQRAAFNQDLQKMDGYTYKGYVYEPWEDVEPDNVKIFHDFRTPDGKRISMDWSPYKVPTPEDIKTWIELGMPGRIGGAPLNSEDLVKIFNSQAFPEIKSGE